MYYMYMYVSLWTCNLSIAFNLTLARFVFKHSHDDLKSSLTLLLTVTSMDSSPNAQGDTNSPYVKAVGR